MLQEIQSLIKLLLTAYLIKQHGLFLGTVSVFILFNFYRILMKQIFSLEMLTSTDKLFVGRKQRERMMLMCVMKLDNFNAETLRSFFIEKVIKQVPKLRKKVIYSVGNYYWKDVPISEWETKIQIVSSIKTEDEAMILVAQEQNLQIDTLKTIPYEIKLVPYQDQEGKGMIIWKFDHVLSDGLGFLSTICAMADNYNINLLPSIMRSYKHKWYMDVFNWISFIYYGPIVLFKMLNSDITKSPFREKPISTGYSKFKLGRSFSLEKFSPVRKLYNISFNDLIMSLISKVANRYISENNIKGLYDDLKSLNILIPVGRKEVPESIQSVEITNKLTSIFIPVPLIDDVKTKNSKVGKTIKNAMVNSGITNAMNILGQISLEYLPESVYAPIGEIFASNIDMAVSNVPGPISPLFFSGCKVEKIIPIASTQRIMAFVPIFSYNSEFSFSMSVDVESGIDNEKFIKYLEEELLEISK